MSDTREVETITYGAVDPGIRVREMSLTTSGVIEFWSKARTPVLQMDSISTRVKFQGLTVFQVAHQISMQRLFEAYQKLLRDFSSTKCNFCAATCSQMIPQVIVRRVDSETYTFHAFMCPTCDNHVDNANDEMQQLQQMHTLLQQLQLSLIHISEPTRPY